MLYILFRPRKRKDGRVSINCRIILDGVRASEFATANKLKYAYLRAGAKPREKDITTAIKDFLATELGNSEKAANAYYAFSPQNCRAYLAQ